MITGKLLLGCAFLCSYAPLIFNPTDSSVRTLRSAGYTIEGRDPCDGTGVCCALLPANKENEVYYLTLSHGKLRRPHLELIKRFSNLRQVRAHRPVPLDEYIELKNIMPDGSVVLVNIVDD